MSIAAFLEKVVRGRASVERNLRVSETLSAEREDLWRKQNQLRGDVRQYEQVVDSSSRIMDTMTHAMIMVEANRGGKRKT